jgi:methionyl-tRNA formyltransferase
MSKASPRIVFFGTPHMAVYVLDALESHGILPALIVCAQDKPQGRGLEMKAPPAKEWAMEREIEVTQPQTLKDESFVQELQNTEWDVFVTTAYAKLIPKNILDIPLHGSLNVHPSLLPKLRGPVPYRLGNSQ